MKPENAINVPEKYRKIPSQKTEETKEERQEEIKEESFDIDPRQAAVEDIDLSKVI